MARLPYLDARDLQDKDAHLLDRPINIFRALAHSPGGLACMAHFGHWIRYEATLPPRLRELAILEVGLTRGSEYEFAHHAGIAQDFGVPASVVAQLPARAAGQPYSLEPMDELVLCAADQLSAGSGPTEEIWRALRDALGDEQLVELVLVITHYVQVTLVLGAFDIDIEPDYQQYLGLMAPKRAR